MQLEKMKIFIFSKGIDKGQRPLFRSYPPEKGKSREYVERKLYGLYAVSDSGVFFCLQRGGLADGNRVGEHSAAPSGQARLSVWVLLPDLRMRHVPDHPVFEPA